MSLLVLRIAWRFLKAPRNDGFISVISWFSVVGICLGVATLIIVLAVMNGFRKELISKIVGVHGHIVLRGTPYALPHDHSLEPFFKDLPQIITAVPFVEGQAMASANNFSLGTLITGMNAQDISKFPDVQINPQALKAFQEGKGVIIGTKLAEKMGISIGQPITFISSQTSSTAFGRIPRSKSFPVVGFFSVGMYQIDNFLSLLPLKEAAKFFRIPEGLSGYKLFIHNPDDAPVISDKLRQILPEQPSTAVSNWQNNHAVLTAALTTERNVMFIILTLIILVAAFNIVSGQIMLVREKSRGIAILRTMGISQSATLSVFLLIGSALGFFGTLLGCSVGVVFAYNLETMRIYLQQLLGVRLFQDEIYFLSKLPSEPLISDILLVSASALILVFLASLYPAWRAMRLEPVAILQDH